MQGRHGRAAALRVRLMEPFGARQLPPVAAKPQEDTCDLA